MVRIPPGAENKQPKPDPITDDEVDTVFDGLYDITSEGAAVRWASRTPHNILDVDAVGGLGHLFGFAIGG